MEETTKKHLLHPQPDPTIQNISRRFSKLYINHKKKYLSQPTTITTFTVNSNSTAAQNNLKKGIILIKAEKEKEKEEEEKIKKLVPFSIPPQVVNNNNDKNEERRKFFSCAGVKVVAVDMPPFMQIHAVDCARKTHDSLEKFTSKTLALTIKKEFDGAYGPAWHCIVGNSFGSFVTHSVGGFMYFSMDHKLYILLFKTTVQRAAEPELTPS